MFTGKIRFLHQSDNRCWFRSSRSGDHSVREAFPAYLPVDRPIKSVHGGIDSLGDPDGDGLRGQDQSVVDGVSFRASEPAQDIVGGVDVLVVADADPEPGKLVGAQMGRDVAQPF